MSEPSQVKSERTEKTGRLREVDQELEKLWRQGQRPDVGQFLAGAGALSLAQIVAVLATDQRERWQSGERVPAEHYLQQYPVLQADVEKALELVYGEVLLREGLSETPALEEYLQRFPQYAARLRQQFDLHRALDSGSSQLDPSRQHADSGEAISSAARARGNMDTPPDDPIESSSTRESRPHGAAEATRTEQPQRARPLPVAEPGERYTLTRLHAQGGLGQVWLARDATLGREIALKELRPERAEYPALRARFLEEATITGQLEHPGIVPVYEVAQRPSNDQPFYTMRFIRGRTLSEASLAYHGRRQAGEAGTLEQVTLLNAFVAVCNAVAYAHARGVLHRDLKGRNVVLGDFGEVIVLDWGLAKVKEEKTKEPSAGAEQAAETLPRVSLLGTGCREDTTPGQVLGTPGYMAPEQAAGRLDELDERTDVYGLGALLYETLTGQAPFTDEILEEILFNVVNKPPVPPRAIVAETPPALEAICLKALAKKPHDRYASAAELAQEVQRHLADEPVTAYGEPLPARLGRWARHHRTLVTSSAATILVALVSLTLAIFVLNAANQKLIAANEREHDAKLAAESNYRLARDAVDQYLVKVSKDRRLSAADLRELRKDLLEEAGKFYTRFIKERGQDAGLESELAHAYFELGVVRGETSLAPQAIDLFQKGLTVMQRLAQSNPDEVKYQRELVSGHHRLSTLYLSTGNTAEAEREFNEASRLLRGLMKREPGEPSYKLQWASLRHNVAILADQRGQVAEAEKTFLEIVDELTRAVEVDPGAADLRHGLAESLNSLGTVYWSKIGRFADAEKYHGLALHHYEELIKKDPNEPDYRNGLARTQVNLGSLYWHTGRRTEAVQMTKRGVDSAQQLADQHREVPDYQCEVAAYLTNLGTLYQETNQAREAEQAHRRSLDVLKQVVDGHSEIAEYRSRLASAHRQLGACYLTMAKLPEAERELLKAIQVDEQLAAAHADVISHQLSLGSSNRFLGDVKFTAGEPSVALTWYGKAADRLKAVLQRAPEHADAKRELHFTYEAAARACARLGKHADALQAWERALEFPEETRDGICRAGHAVTLARMHEPKRAIEEIERVLEKDDSALMCYNAACVFALSGDTPGLDSERAEQYAERAMELVRKAVEKGYPNLEEMKNDKDFDSLRQRADFKQLFSSVEKKTPPHTPKVP